MIPLRQVEGAEDEKRAQTSFTALSPVQIAARGEVKIGHFDVSRFTKTVGPFDKVEDEFYQSVKP